MRLRNSIVLLFALFAMPLLNSATAFSQSTTAKVTAGSISEIGQWPLVFLNIKNGRKRGDVVREIFKDDWGQIVPVETAEGSHFTIGFIVQPKSNSKGGAQAILTGKFTSSNLESLDSAWISSDHRGQMIAYRQTAEGQTRILWLDANGSDRPAKAIKELMRALSANQQAAMKSSEGQLPTVAKADPEKMSSTLRPTILYRERAKYTEEARQNKIEGVVLLSVVYRVDGRISDIRVARGLPNGLTTSAIKAAQKIRFRPAMRDGQPVSVRGNVEFTFSLY